jgi:hypothetical protein
MEGRHVSISQRDQWVRIYQPTTVQSGGFSHTVYEFTEGQWGRRMEPGGRELTFGAQGDFAVQAVVALPDYAVVSPGYLLAVEGVYWRVHAALERRLLSEIQCLCSRATGEPLTIGS